MTELEKAKAELYRVIAETFNSPVNLATLWLIGMAGVIGFGLGAFVATFYPIWEKLT